MNTCNKNTTKAGSNLFGLDLVGTFLLSVCIFLTSITVAQERNLHFIHYNTSNGLSHNNIINVFQDSKDFLWITTSDGLNRFDGKSFVNFFHSDDDHTTISSNSLFAVTEDNKHRLVVSGTEGIDIKNKIDNQFRKKFISETAEKPAISYITTDNQRHFWVASSYFLYVLNDSFKILKKFPVEELGGKQIYNVKKDSKGFIWVNCSEHLNKIDPLSQKIIHLSNESSKLEYISQKVSEITFDEHNNVWVIFAGRDELCLFNSAGIKIKTVKLPQGLNISNMFFENKKNIWLSTHGQGLIKYDVEFDSFKQFTNSSIDYNSISSNVVNGVFQDKSGNIWIYTDDGLNVLQNNEIELKVWGNFTAAKSEITSSGNEISSAVLENGNLWVGGWGTGLFCLNLQSNKKENYPCGRRNIDNLIWSVLPFDNEIWYGSFSGLHIFNPKNKQHRNFLNNPTYPVKKDSIAAFCLFKDKEHSVWISLLADNGILNYDSASKKFRHFSMYKNGDNYFPFGHYDAIAQTDDGKIWMGSNRSKGLVFFDKKLNRFQSFIIDKKPVFNDNVNCLFAQGEFLWIGTNNGLYKMNLKDFSINKYTRFQGLVNNNVNSIVADTKNNIFIGTANGISQMNVNGIFTSLNRVTDLPQMTIQNSFYDESSQITYFVSSSCIFSMDASKSFRSQNSLIPSITEVNVNGTATNLQNGNTLNLNEDDRGFSFEFTAPHFPSSENVSYAYKLDGYDKNWQTSDKRSYASYTNLKYGKYKFWVKASIDGEHWSMIDAPILIICHAPFYMKSWFWVLFLFVIISITFFIFYLNYRIELNKILFGQKIREKISQDIHDEISSGLTKISWISESLKYKLKVGNKENPVSLVDKIIVSTRETINNLSEIIWSSNPENDSADAFLYYLRNHISSFLEETPFSVYIDFPEYEIDRKMNPELIRNLFLIVKESLNNAVKYSNGNHITVSFRLKQNDFRLAIKDNGKGFIMDEIKITGNGISNMKKRANQINATIKFNSFPKEGTEIIVEGKLY